MSDALTNSEIEDVLTSVRRLVTHDTRKGDAGPAAGGRLILTQAQRIDAAKTDAPKAEAAQVQGPAPKAESEARQAAINPQVNSAPEAIQPAVPLTDGPDFRRLEATIAELEAAVSASGSVFEPDGTESAPASNVTALYAKPSFLHARPAESFLPPTAPSAPPASAAQKAPATDVLEDGDADDDELFETVIDEATLRILVAQIVREELQGQLGERITLQVRKLVRSEIAKALDSRDLI